MESRPPEPGASLPRPTAHCSHPGPARVQPDISMQRSLLSSPIRYTDIKGEKFQSGVGKSCVTERTQKGFNSSALYRGATLPSLFCKVTWTRGAACSQMLGGVFTVNDTSHLRLCDNAFLKNRMPQSPSAPAFPLRFTHFWKVTKVVGELEHEKCKGG